MAIKKYTNRPELVASEEGWTYVPTGSSEYSGYSPGQIEYTYSPDILEGTEFYSPETEAPYYGTTQPTVTQPSYYGTTRPTTTTTSIPGADFVAPVYSGKTAMGVTKPATVTGRAAAMTQYKQPIGQTTTTEYTGTMPTLELPKRSAERVQTLTRKAMAPRLRNLRQALNRALVRTYENPNVRRMVTREALQGYGAGVEEARAGAEKTAEQQEAAERAVQIQEALANYQAALQKYMAGGQKTTTNIYAGTTKAETEKAIGVGGKTATFGALNRSLKPGGYKSAL